MHDVRDANIRHSLYKDMNMIGHDTPLHKFITFLMKME